MCRALSTPRPPHSYLCFESSKSGSSKRNKVIKLVDITDIQKVGATPISGAGGHPGSGVGQSEARGHVDRRAVLLGGVCAGTRSARVLWLARPGPVRVLPSRALWKKRSWGAGRVALTPGEPQGDAPAACFQYKVLSVLPGSGMGIAVSTPSTQKVKVLAGAPGWGGLGVGSARVAWPRWPWPVWTPACACLLPPASRWCSAPWYTETRRSRPSSAST